MRPVRTVREARHDDVLHDADVARGLLPGRALGEPLAVGLTLLAEGSGGVLDRRSLSRFGLASGEIATLVRQGELVRIHRDAYRLPAGVETPQTAFLATVRAVRQRHPSAVLLGSAAVAELGLPVFGQPSHVHVAVGSAPNASGRSVFRSAASPPPEQLRARLSGAVAQPARACLDAARLDGLVPGVVAADVALRRGMTTSAELAAVVATMTGLRGVGRSRQCVELASPQSESPGESWSAVLLHQHGIMPPQRQHVIMDDDGVVGRVDFYWPDAGVVGEFDGRVKYGRRNPSGRPPEDVLWDEKVREDRVRAVGLHVVRWGTPDLHAPARWLRRLRAALGLP
ncbi:type IV toxin-antitoxin system AbiEi family antitoxin domain-containing protein [Actinotalea ferrariae]|uniref:type IV toxin-antitoxin system AbiEi family antitoxin domain-containing protein n=1 Tax=Actinotalea ferrariae TaxID=1386098 RepID=UPI001C8C5081|nr:type IV toxin-antitoxin system AbiEi family antitoxin domain-containing protein [Actinotalea ferrariae]MBX9246331.1 type IV toxin-antitoxin system AbiEi family antitoxin domain-containing protein [Actinotalea ferrariae]